MGYASPATDYVEKAVSPNGACNWYEKPDQYLMRAAEASWRAGIKKDAVLAVDASRKPVDGSIVVANIWRVLP